MTTESRPCASSLPAHVGVFFGISAGAYALTLAAMSGLQASSESALRLERDPMAAAIGSLATRHDLLDARLADARAAYDAAASTYTATGSGFQELAARLAELNAAVAEAGLTAESLPANVRIPVVAIAPPVTGAPVTSAGRAAAPAPRSATPAAAGAPVAAAPAAVFVPAPVFVPAAPRVTAPAPAPVTNATTSASGKP